MNEATRRAHQRMGLIVDIVANAFGVTTDNLKSRSRTRRLSYPRRIAGYLLCELSEETLQSIGDWFGDKHHTSIIYMRESVVTEKHRNPALQATLVTCRAEIESGLRALAQTQGGLGAAGPGQLTEEVS